MVGSHPADTVLATLSSAAILLSTRATILYSRENFTATGAAVAAPLADSFWVAGEGKGAQGGP